MFEVGTEKNGMGVLGCEKRSWLMTTQKRESYFGSHTFDENADFQRISCRSTSLI